MRGLIHMQRLVLPQMQLRKLAGAFSASRIIEIQRACGGPLFRGQALRTEWKVRGLAIILLTSCVILPECPVTIASSEVLVVGRTRYCIRARRGYRVTALIPWRSLARVIREKLMQQRSDTSPN